MAILFEAPVLKAETSSERSKHTVKCFQTG